MISTTALADTGAYAGKSRPARVLLLESGTGPGGSVNFLRDFAVHLDGDKLRPIVGLYLPNSSATLKEIRSMNVPVIVFGAHRPSEPATGSVSKLFDTRLKRIRVLRTAVRIASRALLIQLPLAWRLRRFIREEAVDMVVLNQDVHFHIPGVLGARLAGVPCICRKAGGIGEARRLKRLLNSWVDLFVSISKATEADQRATPGTKRLINIYEGVDLSRFDHLPAKEVIRKELGLPGCKKVVATISRIEKGKGQIEFIRMAALILEHYQEAAFLIVGGQQAVDGPLLAELKTLARSLNIEDHVLFAGWRDDIPAVLKAIDIFVHCPTTFIEGLARTCLEAMSAGVPAVVSNNGGMPDAVVDGISGFVVPPGDIEAMAGSVLTLLKDQDFARECGRRGRSRVEQVFDMARNARALQDVLLEFQS